MADSEAHYMPGMKIEPQLLALTFGAAAHLPRTDAVLRERLFTQISFYGFTCRRSGTFRNLAGSQILPAVQSYVR
jgi:hypothetical protein